jgi:hypothetical protein
MNKRYIYNEENKCYSYDANSEDESKWCRHNRTCMCVHSTGVNKEVLSMLMLVVKTILMQKESFNTNTLLYFQ